MSRQSIAALGIGFGSLSIASIGLLVALPITSHGQPAPGGISDHWHFTPPNFTGQGREDDEALIIALLL